MSQSELPQSWQVPPADAPTLSDGRYRLASKIGEGGMASVYRAWDMELEQWVAVKVLLPEFARRKKLRRRFANEGRTMMQLDHRNIVRITDVGPDDDLPYLAMEIADGGCVIDWIEAYGPMPPRLAIDVIMQACKGLKAAHAQGIVHRDVKPHNILITRRGRCQLTDFGIAQLDEGAGMTKTGSVMGTLGYMAPEQRTDSKNVDGRADVYGLGASLYKLVTGGTVADLFLAEHNAEMLDGVPAPIVPVLLKATAYKAEQRYQTVVALAQALHRAKQALPADPEDTPALPLTISGELGAVPTLSDLSEPTFAQVPEGLPDERELRSGALRPAVQQADDESTDVTPLSSIPYSMPRNDVRRDDPDYVPDYIDQESLPGNRIAPEVVELDAKNKAKLEEDFKRAVEAGVIDEDGFIIEGRKGRGRKGSFWNPIEGALGLADGVISEFIALILRPLQIATICGIIALVIGGMAVGSWAGPVKEAQFIAMTHRADLFQTFDANKEVIEDLEAIGSDAGTLQSFWFDYEKAEGPAKVDQAYKLLHRIEQSYTHARKFGETKRAAKMEMAHERMNRLKLAVTRHEQAMLAWEQAADGSRGRTAIRFGAAIAPDM